MLTTNLELFRLPFKTELSAAVNTQRRQRLATAEGVTEISKTRTHADNRADDSCLPVTCQVADAHSSLLSSMG